MQRMAYSSNSRNTSSGWVGAEEKPQGRLRRPQCLGGHSCSLGASGQVSHSVPAGCWPGKGSFYVLLGPIWKMDLLAGQYCSGPTEAGSCCFHWLSSREHLVRLATAWCSRQGAGRARPDAPWTHFSHGTNGTSHHRRSIPPRTQYGGGGGGRGCWAHRVAGGSVGG